MVKEKSRYSSRVRNLIVICALTAIIIAVSTYAWFVGMQTVNVTNFDVEIEATDSLLLSLDGERWTPELTISDTTLEQMSYKGHSNNWSKLIPMSTIGAMDVNASRMILFEKSSMTATKGGYRIMASRVENYLIYAEDPDGDGPLKAGDLLPEKDGYVVFDLFIRNFSGRQYIEELNYLDEEAIYLTTDSSVTVAETGVANTGLENSVRVAFTQIGRVNGTITDAAKITGITCNSDKNQSNPQPVVGAVDGVTGICREARIWEPNDIDHVAAAISWYTKSCRIRKEKAEGGADITLSTAYTASACTTIEDKNPYPTYVVNSEIKSSDNVDVYDGDKFNTYTSSTKLTKMEKGDTDGNKYKGYFTDSMKILEGTDRPTFMYLAPNSVTKVRIYIYIEGQDVDNYDFSSIGKRIAIKFGFTKQRLIESDIDYEGPTIDTTRPVITLGGDNPMTITVGSSYVEPENSFTVTDNSCIEITDETRREACLDELEASVVIDSSRVNTSAVGTYYVTYDVEDSSGNHAAQRYRTVEVVAESGD